MHNNFLVGLIFWRSWRNFQEFSKTPSWREFLKKWCLTCWFCGWNWVYLRPNFHRFFFYQVLQKVSGSNTFNLIKNATWYRKPDTFLKNLILFNLIHSKNFSKNLIQLLVHCQYIEKWSWARSIVSLVELSVIGIS